MLLLDYNTLLTVCLVLLYFASSGNGETGVDPLGFLASYNDSEDPESDFEDTPNPSSRSFGTKDDPLTVSDNPGKVIPIHDGGASETRQGEDDIYVDPEYVDEDENEEDDSAEIEDEDEEGEVLNWVHKSIGSGIFDDVEKNEALLNQVPDDHALVYPVQIRKNQVLGLSTHDTDKAKIGVHYHHTNLLFRLKGKKYKLKLSLNKDLISLKLKQKRNIDDKTQIIEEGSLENCFYHGEVRKQMGSKVIVNTCHGISGLIVLDNVIYVIQPLKPLLSTNETRWPHVIYEPPELELLHKSANARGIWQSFRDLHVGEFMRRRKIMTAMKNEFDTLSASRRLELGLVADHSVMLHRNNSIEDTLLYLGQLANILDAVQKEMHIRVTLKYVEVWNAYNLVPIDSNTRVTLHNFFNYRQETLSFVDMDVVHLITGQPFSDSEVGMSIPDSICTRRAVGVSFDADKLDPLRTANSILHMMGHELGLTEQPLDNCPCPHVGGCLMSVTANGSIPHHALYLSPCARVVLEEALLGGLGSCLLENPPLEVFHQECGNGHVERGEECDCLSIQECRIKDPCCNPKTCLLQPWATCRFGDCCDNCTLVPSSYMCRLAETECDVPEFCTGKSGYCPNNAIVQNGWPCYEGESYCYQGLCQTYSDQCRMIWGGEARPADLKCYETFNTAGRFNGHCGTNTSSSNYIKCINRDVSCGLIHCEGGDPEPSLGKDNVFSTTTVNSAGINYECKIISSHNIQHFPYFGMVQDGTKCDNDSICVGAQCISLDKITSGVCILGPNNLVCSGRGVCSSEITCFCNNNFTGVDCSEFRKQVTFLPKFITSIASQFETQTTPEPVEIISTTTVMQVTTVESPVITKAERSASTLWLVIVLSSVAGGALVLLGCCMICYRRKSSVTFTKKKKKKKKNPSIFGSLTSFSSSNSKGSRSKEDSGDEITNRIISFGHMPSYRADKIKKVMRKTAGEQSGDDSEHNSSNRNSAEVKTVHTLPLAKPPERGILKKYPRSSDDLLSALDSGSDTEPMRRQRKAPTVSLEMEIMGSPRKRLPRGSVCGESGELESMLPHNYEEIGDLEQNQDADECGSCCSCDNKSNLSLSDGDCCDCCSDNKDQQTQTDPDSAGSPELPRDLSSDSLEGAKNKIIKLKNINELLKQIDEQFNSVLRQTTQGDLSPGGSDELRGSETEADRHFPRSSFYKQSDIEEGYSPPHRSPILSPNPSTQHSSTQYSGNLGSDSPEPMASPSGILSPILAESPLASQYPAPLASPSPFAGGVPARYRDPLRGPRHTTSTPKSSRPKDSQPTDDSLSTPLKASSRESDSMSLPGAGSSSPVPLKRQTSPPGRDPPQRGSPTPRGDPTRTWSPPREGSPPQLPGDRQWSPSRIPIAVTIPRSPTRPAPQLVRSPGGRYSPKFVVPPKPVELSDSKPSPKSESSNSPKSLPRNLNDGKNNTQKVEPPVTAIPYRGVNRSVPGSPTPQPRNKPGGSLSGSPTPKPRNKSNSCSPTPKPRNLTPESSPSPSPGTSRSDKSKRSDKLIKSGHSPKSSGSFLSKLAHPFEGNPFKRRGSHSNDGNSLSEGYYSDRADPEEAVIIREIPVKKPVELPFMPNPNGSYTRAPGSPGSPEDINV